MASVRSLGFQKTKTTLICMLVESGLMTENTFLLISYISNKSDGSWSAVRKFCFVTPETIASTRKALRGSPLDTIIGLHLPGFAEAVIRISMSENILKTRLYNEMTISNNATTFTAVRQHFPHSSPHHKRKVNQAEVHLHLPIDHLTC